MSLNTNGLIYEQTIYENLKSYLPSQYKLTEVKERNFQPHGTDIEFFKHNVQYHLEIKRDIFAQMGGTSIKFDGTSFDVVGKVSSKLKSLLLQSMQCKEDEINQYLDFMEQNNPLFKTRQLPFMVPVPIWEEAKNIGLLQNLNHFIEYDVSFIKDHYTKKNVNYIQIGGEGLYHLGKNPLGLNVPELDGEINIEIRLCRAGSKKRDINGTEVKVASAGYRSQARLVSLNQSNFNLENNQDIVQIFQ